MKKNKVTPRTNKRKVVCSVCGANINSDNKIIHSRRRHQFLRKYLAENICTDAFLPELHSSGVLYDARTLESYSNKIGLLWCHSHVEPRLIEVEID